MDSTVVPKEAIEMKGAASVWIERSKEKQVRLRSLEPPDSLFRCSRERLSEANAIMRCSGSFAASTGSKQRRMCSLQARRKGSSVGDRNGWFNLDRSSSTMEINVQRSFHDPPSTRRQTTRRRLNDRLFNLRHTANQPSKWMAARLGEEQRLQVHKFDDALSGSILSFLRYRERAIAPYSTAQVHAGWCCPI